MNSSSTSTFIKLELNHQDIAPTDYTDQNKHAQNPAPFFRPRKNIEIKLPSFSFYLHVPPPPPFKYYLLTWQPVWKAKDKHEPSMPGFLTNAFNLMGNYR